MQGLSLNSLPLPPFAGHACHRRSVVVDELPPFKQKVNSTFPSFLCDISELHLQVKRAAAHDKHAIALNFNACSAAAGVGRGYKRGRGRNYIVLAAVERRCSSVSWSRNARRKLYEGISVEKICCDIVASGWQIAREQVSLFRALVLGT